MPENFSQFDYKKIEEEIENGNIKREKFDKSRLELLISTFCGKQKVEDVIRCTFSNDDEYIDIINQRRKIYYKNLNNYPTLESYVQQVIDYAIEIGCIEEC